MSASSIMAWSNNGSPMRATYVNLYPPESDAEFVRSVTTAAGGRRPPQHVKVVDSYSCRQMYLKSYKFTRKESGHEKAKKCLAKVKGKITGKGEEKASGSHRGDRGFEAPKRLVSCSAFLSALRRLLSCTSDIATTELQR